MPGVEGGGPTPEGAENFVADPNKRNAAEGEVQPNPNDPEAIIPQEQMPTDFESDTTSTPNEGQASGGQVEGPSQATSGGGGNVGKESGNSVVEVGQAAAGLVVEGSKEGDIGIETIFDSK